MGTGFIRQAFRECMISYFTTNSSMGRQFYRNIGSESKAVGEFDQEDIAGIEPV